MAQDYDKIFKENIIEILLPLSQKLLGINIKKTYNIKEKLQTTIEKEPDFVKIVEDENNEKFILHIEFQTTDERDMIYRMQEYNALLVKVHRLPVRQFVIYFGESKISRMKSYLSDAEIYTGFNLINFKEQSYHQLIKSKIPEEIIMAILANFEDEKPNKVIEKIIRKLQETKQTPISFQKYVTQLSTLSRLRNLSNQIKNIIDQMPITYNIKEDAFYKEGKKTGEKKGEKKSKDKMIINLLKMNVLSFDKIAQAAEVSENYVREVAAKLDKEN